MAEGTLKLVFETMGGRKTWSFKRASTDATAEEVNALMNTMITNGSIYKYPPMEKVSATMVVTQETHYQLN